VSGCLRTAITTARALNPRRLGRREGMNWTAAVIVAGVGWGGSCAIIYTPPASPSQPCAPHTTTALGTHHVWSSSPVVDVFGRSQSESPTPAGPHPSLRPNPNKRNGYWLLADRERWRLVTSESKVDWPYTCWLALTPFPPPSSRTFPFHGRRRPSRPLHPTTCV